MSIAVNHKEKGTEEEKKHMNEIGLEYTIFFANSIYQCCCCCSCRILPLKKCVSIWASGMRRYLVFGYGVLSVYPSPDLQTLRTLGFHSSVSAMLWCCGLLFYFSWGYSCPLISEVLIIKSKIFSKLNWNLCMLFQFT